MLEAGIEPATSRLQVLRVLYQLSYSSESADPYATDDAFLRTDDVHLSQDGQVFRWVYNSLTRRYCRQLKTCTTCRFFPDASCLRRQLGNVRLHVPLGIAVTKLLQSGYGKREIRTLAPISRPTPLAEAPLQPLEYLSNT